MVLSFLFKMGSLMVGTIMPAFMNFKAQKNRDQVSQRFFNKYWVVFACFSAIETVADSFYLTYFIPGYQVAKFLFLTWAALPFTGGGAIVYDKVVAPALRQYERELDSVIGRIGYYAIGAAKKFITNVAYRAFDSVSNLANTSRSNSNEAIINVQRAALPAANTKTMNSLAPKVMPLITRPHKPSNRTENLNFSDDSDSDMEYMPTEKWNTTNDFIPHALNDTQIKQEGPEIDEDVEFLAHYAAPLPATTMQLRSRTSLSRTTSPAFNRSLNLAENSQSSAEDSTIDDTDYAPIVPQTRGRGRGRGRGAAAGSSALNSITRPIRATRATRARKPKTEC